jgi:hypothetical protein
MRENHIRVKKKNDREMLQTFDFVSSPYFFASKERKGNGYMESEK